MAVFRINKTKDYTVMSNIHLQDRNLSLKAKGLLSIMLSLPKNWDYSIAGLVAICRENETAIKSALKELKTQKYLVVKKKAPHTEGDVVERSRFEYEYNIYENPQNNHEDEKQEVEKQEVEILGVEILGVENRGQLNTKEENTKEKNTKDFNYSEKRERFRKPTLDEVRAYCLERGNNVNAQKFINYYESIGWKVGKNPMKDWKAAVRTWENNNKTKPTEQKPVSSYDEEQQRYEARRKAEADARWAEIERQTALRTEQFRREERGEI